MTSIPRRRAMLVGAANLPVVRTSVLLPRSAPSGVPALAAEYHRLAGMLPGLDRERDRTCRSALQAEEEFARVQDAASILVDRLESAPLESLADAAALRSVALALVEEDLDPARHELLAAAEAAMERFRMASDVDNREAVHEHLII